MTLPASFDLAILNAQIVDGSGRPPFVGDVAVAGDRIAFVGDCRRPARRVIDAYGKVLAPGFIDIHSHSDYSLLMDPLARSKVFQGVTTEIGGNCGYHAAPIFGQVAREREEQYRQTSGLVVDWLASKDYRRRIASEGISVNYGQQIGYNTLRSAVTADHARPLSSGEREKLRALVREELEQGAMGLSYGLAYAPACFSKTEELFDAAEEAARARAFISFHLRDEGDGLLEALEEAFVIGRATGAALHVGHLKTFRKRNWHKIDDVLAALERERRRGMELTVDRYPHLAMNTLFKFILPTWALEGGEEAIKSRLHDPAVRARLSAELSATVEGEVEEVLISLVGRAENKHVEGKFLDELAQGGDPFSVAFDLIASEGDAAFATFFGMSQDNLDRILALEYTMVASDASIQAIDKQAGGGRPHPRCFDTFPYFLAEWVYARRQLPLEEAIRKVTSLPARRAALGDRGAIGEGMHADLVILDPEALRAEVSFEEPIRYPQGVETVIVNGAVIIDGGRHTGLRPGRLLSAREAS